MVLGELPGQSFAACFEHLGIFRGEPVADVALSIEMAAEMVKEMREFMRDHGTQTTVICRRVSRRIKERRLQYARRNDDGGLGGINRCSGPIGGHMFEVPGLPVARSPQLGAVDPGTAGNAALGVPVPFWVPGRRRNRMAILLEKRDALPPEVAREIKTLAHLENIRRRRADAGQLQDYLRAVPATDYGRRLVLAGARALVEADALPVAQKLIESALDGYSEAGWQPELVAMYGGLTGPGLTARIARAEDWLRQYPGEAGLLLALGRMCMNQRLWGKAQSYIEASLATEETRDAHLALAELCDKLERGDEANRHFRAAVGLEAC